MTESKFDTQLVTLDEVCAMTGALPIMATRFAGKRLETWWDGRPAMTFATARDVAEKVSAARDENDRRNAAMQAEQEAKLQAEIEAAQTRAAERAGQSRVFHGVEVSYPGEGPEPEWAVGE